MKAIAVCAMMLASAHPLRAQESARPNEMRVYKKIGETELALHIFFPPDHESSVKRPAIVFFFGGGWNRGSPRQFYPHCAYFASRGMVAMSAEYRVRSRHGTSPRECVNDGRSAIRWVRAHASELGIDPARVAAGGGSAGGHVAAATAISKEGDEEDEGTDVSYRPDALVLFNPVLDTGPGGAAHHRFGDSWRDLSPMHNIDGNTPPTIVFLGTRDRIIPVGSVERYRRLMTEKARRCDVRLYKGQPHGFSNFRNWAYYARTVVEADRFLASLGFLEGEPTIEAPASADDDPESTPVPRS